ncbi:hypothetical protein [Chlorogloea sp. CCALA 695]|uniref:hypothetical protein n=1 Tax=Chlorogloea sp. CCALA 695 TaxID=2107693 RepID=UPI0011B1D4AB|nr:hypothetical protein [Chlorogloea sp. CCALA 695]
MRSKLPCLKYDNPDFKKLSGVKKSNSIEQLRPMNGWIYISGENFVLLQNQWWVNGSLKRLLM